uniref:DUF6961 family protein n=1 Tax=Altererythrobacter segetis TaxID=1104773 RepID=UPI001FAF2EBC|nr:hypothetical protein [Altererythrobacter segetis]
MSSISDWELWACAQHYVAEHGEDAGVMAAFRCDELLDAGDHEGARTYQAIIERITELLYVRSGSIH